MKIVIDARELRTSTGRYVERLLHYLQEIDAEHEYVVLLTPKDIDGWAPANPNFSKIACPYKEFTFAEQLGLLRQVRGLKADLVHFAVTQQPVLYRGRVVTTVHDLTTARFYNPTKNRLVFAFKQQVYKWVIKQVARKSVHILTPSEFVKNDLVSFARIKPDKVTVTYEAADKITAEPEAVPELLNMQSLRLDADSDFSTSNGPSRTNGTVKGVTQTKIAVGAKSTGSVVSSAHEQVSAAQRLQFIMYVGRPQPHKNLKQLTNAFAIVKREQPDLFLVLAGKNDKAFDQLKSYVSRKSIEDVIFTGFVTEGQLRWLYEHARAYVFPSLSEGFGLPGLEAMHYGLPVVSSNATCLPEIYQDAALYFDPTDANDMAEKIMSVLGDPALAQKLATAGHELVQTYSWRRMAEQTLAIYNKVLKQ